MKTLLTLSAVITLTAGWACTAVAQARFTGYEFDTAGTFELTISGPAEVQASTNLQTWARFATLNQETTLNDAASRKAEWRFYRLRGGAPVGTNVIGFVKISLAPGKMAFVGNPFAGPLSLDSAEQREQVFGSANPNLKLSLYGNGSFQPHTLDGAKGTWTPALRPLRSQEGFTIENTGDQPLSVRFMGEVRQGQFNLAVPAGPALIVPPVPQVGPIPQVLGIPPKDGMQIDVFNEQTQMRQVSTFDGLDNSWTPKPADYRPGRSFLLKSPEPVTWTKSYSANLR